MKSVFYVATIMGAYRRAIDAYYADPERYEYGSRVDERAQESQPQRIHDLATASRPMRIRTTRPAIIRETTVS